MKRRTKWIAGGAVGLTVVGAGTGIGIASSGEDESPLRGTTLDRAAQAALKETGRGTVIETETGDGAAAYGVEILLDDGSVVEVALDEDFAVIARESDDDGSGGEEASEGPGEESGE